MKRASTDPQREVGEKKAKMKSEVRLVSPPLETTLPLERSHLVVHRVLTKSQAGITGMHDFVESINEQLMATGLAVISIEQAPRVLQHCWSRPQEAVDLLVKELGGKYRLNTYTYALEKQTGMEGAYHVKYKRLGKSFTTEKVYEYAQSCDKEGPYAGLPKTGEFDDAVYWQRVEAAAQSGQVVHYPADIHATLLGREEITEGMPKAWNMAEFTKDTDLLRACMPHFNFKDCSLPGCTDSMLYVGAAGTTFLLHAEDQNLFSCNYLLAGAPKVWNGVPSGYYGAMVDLVRSSYSDVRLATACPQAVMHKRFLLRPDVLRAHGIPTCRVIQRPGDLVITGPGAFHFGYNTGFNVAEATNFATREWWQGGHLHDAIAAGVCTCKEAPRFHFGEEIVREALEAEGRRFGIDAAAAPVRTQYSVPRAAAVEKATAAAAHTPSALRTQFSPPPPAAMDEASTARALTPSGEASGETEEEGEEGAHGGHAACGPLDPLESTQALLCSTREV